MKNDNQALLMSDMQETKLKKTPICCHKDSRIFAKGLCSKCYLKTRAKATSCMHVDRPAYAKGKCASCYQTMKRRLRNQLNKGEELIDE